MNELNKEELRKLAKEIVYEGKIIVNTPYSYNGRDYLSAYDLIEEILKKWLS